MTIPQAQFEQLRLSDAEAYSRWEVMDHCFR